MDRSKERLIDVAVLGMLLLFAYLMREADRALAGVIVASAVQFWMAKNATGPSAAEVAAQLLAKAAAEQLERTQTAVDEPTDVTVVGQSEPIEVDDVTDPERPKKSTPRRV